MLTTRLRRLRERCVLTLAVPVACAVAVPYVCRVTVPLSRRRQPTGLRYVCGVS